MSSEGLINIDLANKCVKQLEAFIRKGMKSDVYELVEIHDVYEILVAFATTINRCDLLQKKFIHLERQQELLKKADENPSQ